LGQSHAWQLFIRDAHGDYYFGHPPSLHPDIPEVEEICH
jgi:hypothetical protein